VLEAEEPNEPPYFAIQNARLVTGTGQVIENGTLVVSRGLISAVGSRAAIPPEAWVIDGSGLTVYPGLIDALGDLGLKAESPRRGGPGRGGAPQRPPASAGEPPSFSRGPEDRPGTFSWKGAADELKIEDERIKSWRDAGFTSAVAVPQEGLIPGQAAFINLAGDRPRDMVVQAPAALGIRLSPQRFTQGYPSALLGVFAYVKQVFSDAQHYRLAWDTYRQNPRGLTRPNYDRALDPISQAQAERWPVLIPATWAKEIHRAIQLGRNIGVNTLVYGAHQGYEVADLLARENVPVLVSAKWPERSKDADPDAEEPLRILRMRDRAPSTPAALERAGVRFALYSDGISDPGDILRNVRQAVAAGLTEEAALRALTLGTAQIYGLDDRLGSLEEGKIGNLVVTDGDLFGEETKIKIVFVDGKRFDVREKASRESEETAGRWE
jgi:hypothetical protein